MATTRRKFTPEFKRKVVLEALKERKTIHELAAQFEVHPQLITEWKRYFLDHSASVFDKGSSRSTDKPAEREKLIDRLYSQIGQLKVECDFLKKNL